MIDFVDKAENVQGTPLNRANMMAIQGFHSQNTVFNSDGSITQTNSSGDTLKTIFNADGSILEIFTSGNRVIKKTTTFKSNGDVSEVIL